MTSPLKQILSKKNISVAVVGNALTSRYSKIRPLIILKTIYKKYGYLRFICRKKGFILSFLCSWWMQYAVRNICPPLCYTVFGLVTSENSWLSGYIRYNNCSLGLCWFTHIESLSVNDLQDGNVRQAPKDGNVTQM